MTYKILTKTLLLSLLFCFFSGFGVQVLAQNGKIKGTVYDEESLEPLPGVKIVVDSLTGVLTNEEGKYEISTNAGKHQLMFMMSEYTTETRMVKVEPDKVIKLDLKLGFGSTELDIVVISGSQYEKKIAEETVSIDVVKNYLLENNNVKDLAGAVRKVPGVQVMDDQVTIRGGAGYSYGVGTRVLVMVDDLPIVAADLSNALWSFIPIEIAQQTELIKGASSSIYGSAALNGVINVRTGYARSKPETKFTIYQGAYLNPPREEMRWWRSNHTPFFTGLQFSHRRRIKDLDLVFGANFNSEDTYLNITGEQRVRAEFKTRYKPSSLPGLSFGVNGSFMYLQQGRFFLWANNNDGAYKPLNGSDFNERYSLFTIDPHITYVWDSGAKLSFKSRVFNIKKFWTDENLNSRVTYSTLQYLQPLPHQMTLTAGLVNQFTYSRSNLLGFQTFRNFFGAGYAQLEKKFERVSLVGGVRTEFNFLGDSLEKPFPVFRAGMNYKIKEFTFLRASVGQGYRVPSLAERFIQQDFAGLTFFSSPELVPESGLNMEVGLKQGIKVSSWQGYGDVALFWTQYRNMIEYVFHVDGSDFGFKAFNIGNARIAGIEFSLMGEGSVGKFPVRIFGGYTFNYPGDIESDTTQKNVFVYLKNAFRSIVQADSMENSILKYRNQHMLRFDIEAEFWKFTVGTNLVFNSNILNIDQVIEDIVPGIKDFRTIHDKGSFVIDARLSYQMNERSSFTFVAKNVTNREYTARPGMLQPPTNLTLQYKYHF